MGWLLLKNRRHLGPYKLGELKTLVEERKASARDYVVDEADLKEGRLKYIHIHDLFPELKGREVGLERAAQDAATSLADFEREESSILAFSQMDSNDFVPSALVSGPGAPPSLNAVEKVAEPDGAENTRSVFLVRMENLPIKRMAYSAAVLVGGIMLWNFYSGESGVPPLDRREASSGEARPLKSSAPVRRSVSNQAPAPLKLPEKSPEPTPQDAQDAEGQDQTAIPPTPPQAQELRDEMAPPEPLPGAERGDMPTNPNRPLPGSLPRRNQDEGSYESPQLNPDNGTATENVDNGNADAVENSPEEYNQ